MKRTITFLLTKMFAAMIVAAMIVSSAAAQETMWLSTAGPGGDPGAAPANGNNTINLPGVTLGTSKTLYVWATAGTPVTPDLAPSGLSNFPNSTPPSTAYFAYDMNVTTDTGAISFTAAKIENPTIGTANVDQSWTGSSAPATRWLANSSFTLANTSNLTASAVTGMDASTNPVKAAGGGVDATYHPGLTTASNPGGTFGQFYNATQNAFLVGEVTFTMNTATTTAQIHLAQSNVFTTTNQTNFGIGTSVSQGSASPWTPAYTVSDAKFNNAGGATGFAALTGTATLNITTTPTGRRGDLVAPVNTVDALDIDQLMADVKNGLTYGQASALGRNDNVTLAAVNPTDPVSQSQIDFEVGQLVDHNGDTSIGTGNGVGASDPAHVKGTHYGNISLTGTVNGGDLGLVIGNFNTAVPGTSFWETGNFSHSGIVNGGDLGLAIGNFNVSGPGPAPLPGASVVPEPASIVLFGLGGIIGGLALRRRRKS